MGFPLLPDGSARAFDYGTIDGSLCDELLNGDFYKLAEAQMLIEAWPRH